MIRYGRMAATVLLLSTALAIAAAHGSAVDGRWKGTMSAADGSVSITYSFTPKGQVLTGMEESSMFSRSISEGRVDGDKISFKTTVNGKAIEHEGTVDGDTIQLKNHGPYGEFDLMLKRVFSETQSKQ